MPDALSAPAVAVRGAPKRLECANVSVLLGRRVMLRPLRVQDFPAWRDVRRRNRARLTMWEPRPPTGQPDVVEVKSAFAARCATRRQEREQGTGYGFGVFVNSNFAGEMNLSSVQRGAFQCSYVGYWIDEAIAGNGYTPEAFVAAARFAFEDLRLHRLQVAIVPRNTASLRVMSKLGLRREGLAERYLQINGVWEDHYRFAITVEEWRRRAHEFISDWLSPHPPGQRSGRCGDARLELAD